MVARFIAKAGKETQVKQELMKLLAPTRAETGCLNYDLHESTGKAGQFLFHENKTSKDALDLHLQTPRLKNFLGQADQLLAEPVAISLWQQIE